MIEGRVAISRAYLSSPKAAAALALDPYWPKWDSPWWHITLLWELGRAQDIPAEAAEAMLAAIEAKYARFFPNPREPLPAGKDPRFDGLCHCALGNMYQALSARGLDLDARSPWMRAWFLHYQLPDGGLNCDEKAYGAGGASSIQSTVPVLEAVLAAGRPLTPIEEHFVDKGAGYLLDRRLAFRLRDGRLMDPSFLEIGFPRFYDYDLLRGLAFVADWARLRKRRVPRSGVGWAIEALDDRFKDGRVKIEKPGLIGAETSFVRGQEGDWSRGKASTFPLLDFTRRIGTVSEVLTHRWAEIRKVLEARLEG